MRDAIKEDVVRLICRFERLATGRPDCAVIMRKLAVYCLSLRYSSYTHLCGLLERYFSELTHVDSGTGTTGEHYVA
jgi:hypothetical protein